MICTASSIGNELLEKAAKDGADQAVVSWTLCIFRLLIINAKLAMPAQWLYPMLHAHAQQIYAATVLMSYVRVMLLQGRQAELFWQTLS